MRQVDFNRIVIPETRFRRVFDEKKLNELETSIANIGLLHPITLEKGVKNETGGHQWTLRAGERRFRVLKKILEQGCSFRLGDTTFSGTTLPANDYSTLTDLQRLEIEVEENVVRSDFDWRERTTALAALHKLRKAQNPEQTIAATASEVLGKPAVGSQRTVVSDALIIEKHLGDPDVAKAKDAGEALKIIKKKAETAHRAKLAVTFRKEDNPHTLWNTDARLGLETLVRDGKLQDVIVIDPPYGISADGFGDMAGTGHDYKDSKENFDELLTWLPDALFGVTKPGAHCYIFCDLRRFETLHTHMVLAGWKAFPTPLIWDKCGIGMLPHPEHGPRRTYESILYAWKGDRRTLHVKSDVIRIPAVKGLLHGAQKPVALYQDLLSRSANPGSCVLDCFGGSGPILVAANNLRLSATYIEQNVDAYNIALQRAANTGFDDGILEDDGVEIQL